MKIENLKEFKQQLLSQLNDELVQSLKDKLGGTVVWTGVGGEVIQSRDKMGVATGSLKKTISGEVIGDEVHIFMQDYWKYIEYGTAPHMPPVDAMEEWVKVKFGLAGKDAQNAAWAVAMHIKKFGTMPYPFVRSTKINDVPNIMKDIFKK